ncbi:diguanylate cyclase [Thalassotalea sp. PLHSN55]|uniref:diguanylate cyclase n=1 Tax=Thalassotalea sp. PLHSN55 TaxID=3435888 RepID=UPI003F87B278
MLNKTGLIGHYAIPVYLLLLVVSSELYAAENKGQRFDLVLEEIQTLRKTDAAGALSQLIELKQKEDNYTAEQKVKLFELESKILLDNGEYNQAKKQSLLGLNLANGEQIVNGEVSKLYYTLGFANESLGDISQATIDYANGLEIAQSLDDQKLVVYGLTNYGAIYYLTERYERSLVILTDALKIAKQLDDSELKGLVMSELALLYGYLEDDQKAIENYHGCYEHSLLAEDFASGINCLVNLGTTYLELNNYTQAIATLKQAEQQLNANISNRIIHTIYLNLSLALIDQKDSDHQQAYRYLLLAEKHIDDIEQHEAQLFFLLDKAAILRRLKKYPSALSAIEQIKLLLPESQSTSIKYLYSSLAAIEMRIYADLGEYEQAYQIQQNYTDLSYQNIRNEQLNDINDIRIQYESEQADIENEILAQKQAFQEETLSQLNQQKEKQFMGVLIGVGLSLFFAWWLFSLSKSKNKLLRITRTDELTGIANRRYLNDLGFYSFKQAKLHHVGFSVLMVDVDHFKQVNDSLGHSTGDAVLKIIARIGDDIMRGSDTIARVGGEEFICLLIDTTKHQAIDVAHRYKKMVEQHQWPTNIDMSLTISVGVATYDSRCHQSFNDVLKDADALMYQAKNEGRNKVCY